MQFSFLRLSDWTIPVNHKSFNNAFARNYTTTHFVLKSLRYLEPQKIRSKCPSVVYEEPERAKPLSFVLSRADIIRHILQGVTFRHTLSLYCKSAFSSSHMLITKSMAFVYRISCVCSNDTPDSYEMDSIIIAGLQISTRQR